MKNKKLIAIVVASAISMSALGAYSISSFADPTPPAGPQAMLGKPGFDGHKRGYCKKAMMKKMHRKHMKMRGMGMLPAWDLGLMQNKNLSEADAKVITQAALLMYNRKDLQIGSIKDQSINDRTLYVIQLNDAKGNLVNTVVMDSNTGIIRPMPKGGLKDMMPPPPVRS